MSGKSGIYNVSPPILLPEILARDEKLAKKRDLSPSYQLQEKKLIILPKREHLQAEK